MLSVARSRMMAPVLRQQQRIQAMNDAMIGNEAELEQQWADLVAGATDEVRQLLDRLAGEHSVALADVFYTNMMADPVARQLLVHEVVNSRLHAAMERWIISVLRGTDARNVQQIVALQRHVGQVHARINVGVNLVLRGARVLKTAMLACLEHFEVPPAMVLQAASLASGLVDLSVEIMSHQYVQSHELAARTDEAYRSFASSVNMSLERERQRAALLDWESRFLQEVMMAGPEDLLSHIGQSSFGLWIQHKAVAMFRPGGELAAISVCMNTIDSELLPLCQGSLAEGRRDELRRLMRKVLSEVNQIRFAKDSMFEHLVDLETGRDALTQLLNRRFLPAILSREIDLSRRSGSQFSVLLVDVDHFKTINDQHGHTAGDRVLAHLAGVLSNTVRSGDFVFRFGGEEFLVVSVETDAESAMRVAEKIRRAVESEPFLLPHGGTLRATISVGVARYDGHPDYQRLIDEADRALYLAKQAGRNRAVLAS